MDNGRIEAEGTHDALLRDCLLYRELWEAHISAKDTKEGRYD